MSEDSNYSSIPCMLRREMECDETLSLPYAISEIIIGIMAILGNSIVIIVFLSDKKLRRPSNFYIISLAFADLLFGILGIPSAIMIDIGLPRDLNLCLCAISTLLGLGTISIFSLIGVSIDRHWAIRYPMEYSQKSRLKTALINIFTCWFLGFIVGYLPFFGWYNQTKNHKHECWFLHKIDKNYLVFFCFTSFVIPSLILVVIYGLIYRVIHQQIAKRKETRKETIKTLSEQSNQALNSVSLENDKIMLRELKKREIRAAKNLTLIVVFFAICWMPINILNVIGVFWPSYEKDPTILRIFIALSYANSAFNPFLYAYNLKDFRKAFPKLFYRCKSFA